MVMNGIDIADSRLFVEVFLGLDWNFQDPGNPFLYGGSIISLVSKWETFDWAQS